jgi:hypothetical protein
MRLLASAMIIFAVATVASAQPVAAPLTSDDARCLLAMVALSNSDDPNSKGFGEGGIIYFVGRIAATDPKFDLGRLRSIAATMDPESVQADLAHCGPMFQASMEQLADALAGATAESGALHAPRRVPSALGH